MTQTEVPLDSLLNTREQLIKTLNRDLVSNERDFLFSVKKGDPDYTLMPFDNLEALPALRWKLLNIRKMDEKKHTEMLDKLGPVVN